MGFPEDGAEGLEVAVILLDRLIERELELHSDIVNQIVSLSRLPEKQDEVVKKFWEDAREMLGRVNGIKVEASGKSDWEEKKRIRLQRSRGGLWENTITTCVKEDEQ